MVRLKENLGGDYSLNFIRKSDQNIFVKCEKCDKELMIPLVNCTEGTTGYLVKPAFVCLCGDKSYSIKFYQEDKETESMINPLNVSDIEDKIRLDRLKRRENIRKIKSIDYRKRRIIHIILSVVLFSGIGFGIHQFGSLAVGGINNLFHDLNKPTPKKEFKDLTNKEIQDFLEWDQKEQQKKYDNENFFK